MTSIIIPATVECFNRYYSFEEADYAFANCSCLTSAVLPESIIRLGPNIFVECTKLYESHSVEEIDALIITLWEENGRQMDNKLKELLSARKEKIDNAFMWTPEAKASLLHLNHELIRRFEMMRDEALPYLKALQQRVDEKDTILKMFHSRAKIDVFIYTPDEEGILCEPYNKIESVLMQDSKDILTTDIRYNEDKADIGTYYLEEDYNWNIYPPLGKMFDDHFISYAIAELHNYTYMSIQDILRINEIRSELQIIHHY